MFLDNYSNIHSSRAILSAVTLSGSMFAEQHWKARNLEGGKYWYGHCIIAFVECIPCGIGLIAAAIEYLAHFIFIHYYNTNQTISQNLKNKDFKKSQDQISNEFQTATTSTIQNIQQYLIHPLPNDVFQEISQYLDFLELQNLAPLNRQGQTQVALATFRKAKELGYEELDHTLSIKYMNSLKKELNELAFKEIIQKKFLIFKENKKILDLERTLLNFKNFSTEDLFTIFSQKNFYLTNFQGIRKTFSVKKNWKVTTTTETHENLKKLGTNALNLSAQHGDKNILEILLHHGADPNKKKGISSPLHYASQGGYRDIVELVLGHGALVNEQGYGLSTALVFACGDGDRQYHRPNRKVIEILLKHKADPNIPNQEGKSALHFAALAGYAKIVELLLNHGAKINERGAGFDTELIYACGAGKRENHKPNIKVVDILLRHGANPNIAGIKGSYSLHFAAQAGYVEIVERLLENGARVNESGAGRATALIYACGFGDRDYYKPNLKVVEILLKHGADVNILDENGYSALHYAAQAGYAKIVELLLNNGARVNERGAGMNTALIFACGKGDKELHQVNPKVVELLLQHGADPNILDVNGASPLIFARENNYLEIISLLLKNGAHF